MTISCSALSTILSTDTTVAAGPRAPYSRIVSLRELLSRPGSDWGLVAAPCGGAARVQLGHGVAGQSGDAVAGIGNVASGPTRWRPRAATRRRTAVDCPRYAVSQGLGRGTPGPVPPPPVSPGPVPPPPLSPSTPCPTEPRARDTASAMLPPTSDRDGRQRWAPVSRCHAATRPVATVTGPSNRDVATPVWPGHGVAVRLGVGP
jgi:hypothetical protein